MQFLITQLPSLPLILRVVPLGLLMTGAVTFWLYLYLIAARSQATSPPPVSSPVAGP
jgi:hypothetical protein